MTARHAWRRFWMGLATVTGVARLGYFIPYRYAGTVGAASEPRYSALEPIFEAARDRFEEVIVRMAALGDDLERLGGEPPEPRWRQDWFPGLDGAALYAFVRSERPARIVEVGSGHSTRFIARAIRDEGFACAVTAIDPAPRADIAKLAVECVRSTLQSAPRASFEALAAGDIVSVDSSHIAVAGSDVDLMLNDVLPGLPPGVLVHIHDIFLPDDYPSDWSWRGYNEQTAVAPLVHGQGYELLWSSHYVRTRMADHLADTAVIRLPVSKAARESSLWLRKR